MTSPSEIKALLRQLVDGSVPLNINGPDGAVLTTTLWTVDSVRGAISFSASPDDPHLHQIVQSDEAVVVGYLDAVKLQFDANDLVLVHGERRSALSCALPDVIYRFQRRGSYRVRPVLRSSPVARLRHPELAEMSLALRVLDVSLGGCALFLPADVPPMNPGITLNGVELDLDADTRFTTALRLQHMSSVNSDTKGLRIGCEMLRLAADAERQLQRYIDQTQKRRRLLGV
ncbi:MAG: flagellar brake protein [Ideonella sp.]|nr:flagellar brake protein [Ideonella sp.]